MHILSPETDNCPSWISGRERMTIENISWSISTKECCRPRWGLNPRPPGLQSDGASNWATEDGGCCTWHVYCIILLSLQSNERLLLREKVVQYLSDFAWSRKEWHADNLYYVFHFLFCFLFYSILLLINNEHHFFHFYYFAEIIRLAGHYMWIVCLADDPHYFLWKKKKSGPSCSKRR